MINSKLSEILAGFQNNLSNINDNRNSLQAAKLRADVKSKQLKQNIDEQFNSITNSILNYKNKILNSINDE